MAAPAALELEEEPVPAADEPAAAVADVPAAEPLEAAADAPLLAAALPEEEAAPLASVKRVVDPMVEVVTALPPDEMVVTTAPTTS
jgi:hypothetical protein